MMPCLTCAPYYVRVNDHVLGVSNHGAVVLGVLFTLVIVFSVSVGECMSPCTRRAYVRQSLLEVTLSVPPLVALSSCCNYSADATLCQGNMRQFRTLNKT